MKNHQRLEWVDAAKGIAILLVALNHTVLLLSDAGLLSGPWMQLNKGLQVFRMPLFFAASGLFAGSVIRRSWAGLWSTRISLLVWTFVVWTLVRFAYFLVVPMESRPDETSLSQLALAPIAPSTGLWFLHALAFFFLAAKLMMGRIDYRVQLVGAAALSLVFLALPVWNISWNSMGMYFFFFLAGCHLREWIITRIEKRQTIHILLAFGVFIAGSGAMYVFDIAQFSPLGFVTRIAAVALGFMLAAAVMALPGSGILVYLGQRTLPIYVSHIILIACAVTLLGSAGSLPGWVGMVAPVAIASLAVLAAVGLSIVLRGPVFKYAYEPPAWFSGGGRSPMLNTDSAPPSEGWGAAPKPLK